MLSRAWSTTPRNAINFDWIPGVALSGTGACSMRPVSGIRGNTGLIEFQPAGVDWLARKLFLLTSC